MEATMATSIRIAAIALVSWFCLFGAVVAAEQSPVPDCSVAVEQEGKKLCFRDEQAKSDFLARVNLDNLLSTPNLVGCSPQDCCAKGCCTILAGDGCLECCK
jgi:hypothetical protein